MLTDNATIDLRSVNRVLVDEDGSPAHYLIPAYQRGFRWNQWQVTQLLEDVWDFIQSSDDKPKTVYYCLQPLVVRKCANGRSFEVVDGQQRLTTIYLLLEQCKEITKLFGKQCFSIDYATRDSTFLKEIDLKRSNENVDFHHICEAWKTIEKWLNDRRDTSHKIKLLQHLLNDDEVGHNVKFIWYELDPDEDPINVFTRLNVGKIPLTETELVRALFLRRAAQDDSTGNLPLRIAYEWDQIEKRLHNDAVWYFLQNHEIKDSNRIGLIFRLATRMAGRGGEGQHYTVFSYFAELLKSERSSEPEWQKVKDIFMTIDEWHEDRDLFHVVGFILHQTRDRDSLTTIAKLLADSWKLGKQEFSKSLRSKVCEMMLSIDLEKISETELAEEISDLCRRINYANRERLRSLLLLFNLATLLQDPKSNIRFQFESFKCESWDIEHIRSVSDNRPESRAAQKEWLEHCLKFLQTSSNEVDDEKLVADIETYLDSETKSETRKNFEEIDGKILSHFKEAEIEPSHELENLTLLDSKTNRGYKDAVFAVKRDILLQNDRTGIFVPLCTRNVFLKCYSRAVGNAIIWTDYDARHYLDAIIETLISFFDDSGAVKQ
ncbi:MAG: DUF262 domain-containing protein [Aestuariivita sp.]|nr:DUF262 domain-containing protein [Aestuariivita sp.]